MKGKEKMDERASRARVRPWRPCAVLAADLSDERMRRRRWGKVIDWCVGGAGTVARAETGAGWIGLGRGLGEDADRANFDLVSHV